MMTLLILEAVSLVSGVASMFLFRHRPILRKIALGFTLISLVANFFTWLVAVPATALLSYKYMDSFTKGLSTAPFLAKAIACLAVLPMMVGGYLMLRLRSNMWQRMAGLSIVLVMFAGLFFWGHTLLEKENARKQAAAEQVEQEQKVAAAELARVQEQERLAAVERERTHQQELTVAQSKAEAERQRLAAVAAMAEAERARLEIAENARRELAARLETARRERERQEAQRRQLEEERRRREQERQPRLYRAPRPVLASEFFQSTPVVSAEQARELARTQTVYVKNFKAESALAVSDNLEIKRTMVSWETERAPQRVYLIHNGVSAPLCGDPPATPVSCGRTGYQEVPRFDGVSSQGTWSMKFYGNIGWVQGWKLTIQPVVSADGVVARR